jgi:hypothetical protein
MKKMQTITVLFVAASLAQTAYCNSKKDIEATSKRFEAFE